MFYRCCDDRSLIHNNKRVVYDPFHSHTATNFDDTPDLKDLVVQILSHQDIDGKYIGFDVDIGKPVGSMDVVKVGTNDDIIYAKRKNRDEYVSFVKNRLPQLCSYVSLALKQLGDDSYELKSAWIGEFESPPFPEEESATAESVPFWNQHAFIWGSQSVQEDSITDRCPW